MAAGSKLVAYTWNSFRPLAPGEGGLIAKKWVPDWALGQDIAGVGEDGQPVPYYLPGLIDGPESLLMHVVGDELLACQWLQQRYTELAGQRGSLGQQQCRFLQVDQDSQELVVSMSLMRAQVLGTASAGRPGAQPGATSQPVPVAPAAVLHHPQGGVDSTAAVAGDRLPAVAELPRGLHTQRVESAADGGGCVACSIGDQEHYAE
jgi:hypothetical protein